MHQPHRAIGRNNEPVSGSPPHPYSPAWWHAGAGIRCIIVHMETKGKCRQRPLSSDKVCLQLIHRRTLHLASTLLLVASWLWRQQNFI